MAYPYPVLFYSGEIYVINHYSNITNILSELDKFCSAAATPCEQIRPNLNQTERSFNHTTLDACLTPLQPFVEQSIQSSTIYDICFNYGVNISSNCGAFMASFVYTGSLIDEDITVKYTYNYTALDSCARQLIGCYNDTETGG